MTSPTASVLSPTNCAYPTSLSAAGIASTPCVTKPTKRSRSRRTRAITASPSTLTSPRRPNASNRSTAWAASAGAISSLLGMQPTRAHVVPCTPPSISSAARPAAFAARYAASPAVPAPMTATSVSRVGIAVSLRGFAQERLELRRSANQPAVDEHLRHRGGGGDRAERLRAYRVRQRDLGVIESGVGELLLGLR